MLNAALDLWKNNFPFYNPLAQARMLFILPVHSIFKQSKNQKETKHDNNKFSVFLNHNYLKY